MQVPQLIFGSTDRGSIRGYQLLGRSSGIDERAAKEFCRWAPSHGALQETTTDASSLNFFPIEDDKFIIARTVYGGPEYSGRGGLQVVTIGLLLEKHQLALYESNPLAVAETAISLGYLILPGSMRRMLHPVTLPRRSLKQKINNAESGDINSLASDVEKAIRLMTSDCKVVIVGARNPIDFLAQLFRSRSNHELEKFSFSTSLKPSISRDFGIQFLPAADHVTIRQLDSQQVVCLKIDQSTSVPRA